jgi:acetate kinase
MHILVVNAGSSSLKLRLLDEGDTLLASEDLGTVDNLGDGELAAALDRVRRPASGTIQAVGHRIVHGGTRFSRAARIDADIVAALRELTDLAPLHQPKSLAALDAVSRELPDLPAVACFDTAFHATLSDAASTFAVPQEWRTKYSVRRYGFHGLSHAYCARRTAELAGHAAGQLRVVSCHLGAGASLAAIVGGRSVDTTMGFTPLDGLVMATRSGSIDPGLVLWLEEHEQLPPPAIADALEHRSGLLALAGTADMREVEARSASGDPSAQLALDVFVHRLVTGIGAMAAAAGGLDVLAFTGGIGEHSTGVRRLAAGRLTHLGVQLDMERNDAADGDADIGVEGAVARTLVITAREDLQIAREVRDVLNPSQGTDDDFAGGQRTAGK